MNPWTDVLLQLEEAVAANGWDQPGQVLTVRQREGSVEALEIETLQVLEGNPRAALRGLTAPGALAVVLLTEGWESHSAQGGDQGVRPGETPGRQEARQACLVSATGETLMLTRTRGEAPVVHDMAVLSGALPDLLRRVIGVAPPATRHQVGELLGTYAMQLAIQVVGQGASPTYGAMMMCVDRVVDDITGAFAIPAGDPKQRVADVNRLVTWTAFVEDPAFLQISWLDAETACWFGEDALANLLCERMVGPFEDVYGSLVALCGEDVAEDCRDALEAVGWVPHSYDVDS